MAYKRSPMMEERLAGNRERILEAARKRVAAGGFREARIAAVAAEAGISTGMIYRYFPSKGDLFVEVLSVAVENEVAILCGIARGKGSATEKLAAAVASFARRALRGPHLAYAFIAEPTDVEVEAARIGDRRKFGNVFKEILKAGIESGEFPEQNPDVTAACIVGAFTEALISPTGPTRHARVNEEKLVDEIVACCVRSVGAVPGKQKVVAKSKRIAG